jgi:hypothetical protein
VAQDKQFDILDTPTSDRATSTNRVIGRRSNKAGETTRLAIMPSQAEHASHSRSEVYAGFWQTPPAPPLPGAVTAGWARLRRIWPQLPPTPLSAQSIDDTRVDPVTGDKR